MGDGAMKARVVRIRVEEGETGLFFATSPDLRGLLVAKPTVDELDEAIPAAIAALYEALGVNVVVTMLDRADDEFRPWVAVPVEVARRALAAG